MDWLLDARERPNLFRQFFQLIDQAAALMGFQTPGYRGQTWVRRQHGAHAKQRAALACVSS